MKPVRIAAFALFILTLVPAAFASDTIASGPVKPAMGYYFCVGLEDPTPSMPKGRALYSGVFEAEGNSLNPVRDAYVKFIQEKYNYSQDPSTFNSSVQCTGGSDKAQIATTEQYRIEPGKRLNPEGTVETGWTFAGYQEGEMKAPTVKMGHG